MEIGTLNQRVWLLLLLWFPLALLHSTSPYCNFTPLHSLCPHENVGKYCGNQVRYRGVTPKDAALIVDFHNKFRSQVALGRETRGATGPQPHASNMRMMEWDDELAIIAQRDADQCIFGKECVDCRRVSRFGVGQNLFVIHQNKFNAEIQWERILKSWYLEVTNFDPSNIHLYRFTKSLSRYTQMMWCETYKVGCGFAMFLDNGWWRKIYVCNYGPSGNIISREIYQPGTPCSACPNGTICSQKYPGLCASERMTPATPPRLKLVNPYGFVGELTEHAAHRQEADFDIFEEVHLGDTMDHPNHQGIDENVQILPEDVDPPLDERSLLRDLIPFLKKIGRTAQVIRASSARTVQKIRNEVLPPGYRPIILYRSRGGQITELDADTLLPSSNNITEEQPSREEDHRQLLLCDMDISPCQFTRVGGNWSVEQGQSEGRYTQTLLRTGEKALLMVNTPINSFRSDSVCISMSHRRRLVDENSRNSTIPELTIGVLPTGGQVISRALGGTPGLWEMGVVTFNDIQTSFLVVVNVGPATGVVTVDIDAIQVTDGRCCISGIC